MHSDIVSDVPFDGDMRWTGESYKMPFWVILTLTVSIHEKLLCTERLLFFLLNLSAVLKRILANLGSGQPVPAYSD